MQKLLAVLSLFVVVGFAPHSRARTGPATRRSPGAQADGNRYCHGQETCRCGGSCCGQREYPCGHFNRGCQWRPRVFRTDGWGGGAGRDELAGEGARGAAVWNANKGVAGRDRRGEAGFSHTDGAGGRGVGNYPDAGWLANPEGREGCGRRCVGGSASSQDEKDAQAGIDAISAGK